MRVLVACEFSGIVRDAFIARGHVAYSCDLLDSERPGPHLKGDAREYLDLGWDLMVAHPPCTFLTNSGIRWLYNGGRKSGGQNLTRWSAMYAACDFYKELWEAPIEHICIENPRTMIVYAETYLRLPEPQTVHPWEHGHGETKATGLRLKNLPKLVPTNIVEGREARVHRASPGPNRWKERSRTFQGIADAMAAQWSDTQPDTTKEK